MNDKGLKSRRISFVLGISLLMTACSWTDKQGTHHLIVGLGFGIVTTKNDPGVDVMDSRILGAEIGSFGGGLGWLQHHRVVIDPDLASNVIVSINGNPLGLTVKNFSPYSTAMHYRRK